MRSTYPPNPDELVSEFSVVQRRLVTRYASQLWQERHSIVIEHQADEEPGPLTLF